MSIVFTGLEVVKCEMRPLEGKVCGGLASGRQGGRLMGVDLELGRYVLGLVKVTYVTFDVRRFLTKLLMPVITGPRAGVRKPEVGDPR